MLINFWVVLECHFGRTKATIVWCEMRKSLERSKTIKVKDYIVQNPIRAGLAVAAEKYFWSSAFEGGLKPAPRDARLY